MSFLKRWDQLDDRQIVKDHDELNKIRMYPITDDERVRIGSEMAVLLDLERLI
jgi:hypothetical protein